MAGPPQFQALGHYLRAERERAGLSLRELAEATSVSNAYLSQVERGLHEPSIRVLTAIADSLDISGETLLALAGLPGLRQSGRGRDRAPATERAIRADPALSSEQKEALLAVYRSYTGPDRARSTTT